MIPHHQILKSRFVSVCRIRRWWRPGRGGTSVGVTVFLCCLPYQPRSSSSCPLFSSTSWKNQASPLPCCPTARGTVEPEVQMKTAQSSTDRMVWGNSINYMGNWVILPSEWIGGRKEQAAEWDRRGRSHLSSPLQWCWAGQRAGQRWCLGTQRWSKERNQTGKSTSPQQSAETKREEIMYLVISWNTG